MRLDYQTWFFTQLHVCKSFIKTHNFWKFCDKIQSAQTCVSDNVWKLFPQNLSKSKRTDTHYHMSVEFIFSKTLELSNSTRFDTFVHLIEFFYYSLCQIMAEFCQHWYSWVPTPECQYWQDSARIRKKIMNYRKNWNLTVGFDGPKNKVIHMRKSIMQNRPSGCLKTGEQIIHYAEQILWVFRADQYILSTRISESWYNLWCAITQFGF